jgi:hypothetical protein
MKKWIILILKALFVLGLLALAVAALRGIIGDEPMSRAPQPSADPEPREKEQEPEKPSLEMEIDGEINRACGLGSPVASMPEFVAQELGHAHHTLGVDGPHAAPVAWGEGSYQTLWGECRRFSWVSWSEGDGYLQISLSTSISEIDLLEIVETDGALGQYYQAERLEEGQKTWIGFGSEWAGSQTFCSQEQCVMGAVVRYYTGTLTERVPRLTFETRAVLSAES